MHVHADRRIVVDMPAVTKPLDASSTGTTSA